MAIIRGAPAAPRPVTYAQPTMTYAQPTTYAPTTTLMAADFNHDGIIESNEVFAARTMTQPMYIQQPATQMFAADLNHDGVIESNEVFSVQRAQPVYTYAQPATTLVAADLNHDGVIESNEVFAVRAPVTYAQPAVTYAQSVVTAQPMLRQRDLIGGYTVIYEHAITREELMAQGRLDANPAREEQLCLEAARIMNHLPREVAVIGVEMAQ